MKIPPIGQMVLRLKDGSWNLDYVAQVRIGDETNVLVWGTYGSEDPHIEQPSNPPLLTCCVVGPKRRWERFPSGQDEWKRVYRNLDGLLLEF